MTEPEGLDAPAPDEVPDSGDLLTCEVCGTSFEHSGRRGRKPKTCPEHRRSRGGGRSSSTASGEPRKAPGIAELQKQLYAMLAVLGSALALVDPFDSKVVLTTAEEGSKALAGLAAANPSLRRTLETGVQLGNWGPFCIWVVKTTVPIAAHHGLIRGTPDPAKAGGDGAV